MYRKLLQIGAVVVLANGLAACDDAARSGSPSAPSELGPGTTSIQLAGTVSDAAWRPIAGARVEVLDGPQAGLATTSDGNGEYRLSGRFDATTQFRATKDGHAALTKPLPPACTQCDPDWWIHFSLEALAPHANLEGNYSLTFIADSACTGLPDELRSRTYAATITRDSNEGAPANSSYIVAVSGAPLFANYNSFAIGIAGDYLAAILGDFHGTPGISEQIAPNTYLGFEGLAEATVQTPAVSTISASFNGAIDYCELKSAMDWSWGCTPDPVAHRRCESKNHQLILSRR